MIGNYLQAVLDWSEVWALLIPLGVLLFRHQQPPFLKPVIVYVCVALFLNLCGNIIADYKKYFPHWLQSNNPIYNVHSLIRFACFAAFFLALKQPYYTSIRRVVSLLLLCFILVNFLVSENFFFTGHLSGNLLSAEAYALLIYCLLFYLSQLKDEKESITSGADFWVATGLCIYVVINFFVFLFYVPMIDQNPDLADNMWSVHNVAYILLSFFIAKAFYVSTRPEHRT
jgi:hypothetical protein